MMVTLFVVGTSLTRKVTSFSKQARFLVDGDFVFYGRPLYHEDDFTVFASLFFLRWRLHYFGDLCNAEGDFIICAGLVFR